MLGNLDPHARQQTDHVARPSDRDRGCRDRIFQNEVPAYEPGDELTHDGVGVGIRASSHWNHRSQLRVSQRGERTNGAGYSERQHQARTRAFRADGREHENTSADDRPDAQHHELERAERAVQTLAFGVCDALLETLDTHHSLAPNRDLADCRSSTPAAHWKRGSPREAPGSAPLLLVDG